MSSGIAAPNGGRFVRARAGDGARDHERRRLRRYLQVTTLRALESIATTEPGITTGDLITRATDAAAELRALVHKLSNWQGRLAVDELRRQAGATLHDTTLQTLEYLATDGYGAELEGEEIRRIAGDAADELRASLFRLGTEGSCELVSALRRVVADAKRKGVADDVRLEAGDLEGEFAGESTAALVAAVREALNNVRKHANATEVVVRCERAGDGARVIVSDDGVGTDLADLGTGIGLRHSIMGRMARFGGRADFQSAPGAGMQVTMTTDVLGVAA